MIREFSEERLKREQNCAVFALLRDAVGVPSLQKCTVPGTHCPLLWRLMVNWRQNVIYSKFLWCGIYVRIQQLVHDSEELVTVSRLTIPRATASFYLQKNMYVHENYRRIRILLVLFNLFITHRGQETVLMPGLTVKGYVLMQLYISFGPFEEVFFLGGHSCGISL